MATLSPSPRFLLLFFFFLFFAAFSAPSSSSSYPDTLEYLAHRHIRHRRPGRFASPVSFSPPSPPSDLRRSLADSISVAPASAPAPYPSDTDKNKYDDQISAPSPAVAASTSNPASKKKPRAVRWLVGIALGMVTGFVSAIFLSVAFHFIRNRIRKSKAVKPVIYQTNIDSKSIAFLKDANAFEGLEKLGHGASGAVYKAELKISRREKGGRVVVETKTVAIKRVMGMTNVVRHMEDAEKGKKKKKKKKKKEGGVENGGSEVGDLTKNSKQIFAEMETLGKVRHRNLVTLLAYVPAGDAHILVYDYMANGSLHDLLKRSWQGGETDLLPWETRLEIAIGVAEGLKYLHNDARPRIVHRDLKPGNILIDEKMGARIGDFGLARAILGDDQMHATVSDWAGTVGYLAPEYTQTNRSTAMGDVYSFGVVLVVLLTGREPMDPMFADVVPHMGTWVADTLNAGHDHILSVLDPHLLVLHSDDGDDDDGGNHTLQHLHLEQMLLVFKIASFCLQDLPNSRPSSNDVLQMLQQIRSTQTIA